MACGDDGELAIEQQPHVFREPVAAPGNGDDVLVVLRIFSERLAQEEDVPAEVGFFDEGVRPDCFHQVVFGDDLIVVADQHEQDLKCLGRNRNNFVLA